MNFLKSSARITVKIILVLLFTSTVLVCQQPTEKLSSDSIFVMKKSPWGAVLRSAVLPGFGQFYNESYWKIPVIFGTGALFISGWVYNDNLYQDNKDLFINSGDDIYKQRRDFYRDQRDNFTIYLVVLYLLNLVDAYVDAHLYDFTVEEDFLSGASRVNVRFYF
ncbi:MAG: DUF5683 domain-containing protein [Ignavibacteriales bacterium]